MLLTDVSGTPVGVHIESASPHEVTLVESLVSQAQIDLPNRARLLYDKAADSNPLRERLRWQGIRLIAPARAKRDGTRKRLTTRDQRYYLHRWKVERNIAWLKGFRRLCVRWEYHDHLHEGFWQLACLFIILKGF